MTADELWSCGPNASSQKRPFTKCLSALTMEETEAGVCYDSNV